MSRLILRLALGLLVVVVASFLIAQWGFQEAGKQFFEEVVPRLTEDIGKARQRLARVPPDQFKKELHKIADEMGYKVRVLPRDSAEIPRRVHHQLRRGRPFAFTGRRGKHRAYIPLGKGRGLAVLGDIGGRDIFPLGFVVGAILGVVALTAFALAFPMVRRLRRLERTAERISQGDLEARAEEASADSIGSLARRFNVMADRVQELLESQRQLIRAVSHELRTPISRMHFGLEMLGQAGSEQQRGERLAALEQDLTELEQLIQELFTYIRAGDRALELNRQAVSLDGVLAELGPRLGELHPEVTLEIGPPEVGAPPLPPLDADPRHLRRAIKNLLENALRHARERVVVRQEAEEGAVLIIISDDGPGIAPERREEIFEPFTRLDHSRNRESGGVGLGLAIVREIAAAHGGEVSAGDAAEGGAAFTLRWPTRT